ncbi:hypothetical protein BKA67DRAFT_536395 [Truncatella angustata]|uniref:Uncharacterized protein n=1 Tax=Truncatella angustata TaxID=152316 RepID=A0A9P8ZW68_9PEZI|nr:uncharacterized protein BKA67DRAFT_536395 [Truncatella angustata]KAH6652667.1 hypothetical protein BKA67DRAFT_536395 [Truncatella angustata]KAH8196976.1 hypothetical protein TruAng_008870 [Truncatella angustata]
MAMDAEFAKPELGFDPADNQVVKEYYGREISRPAMDPSGQRAATVMERIDEQFESFSEMIGREPTEEEKNRMEEVQIKCSGWLEGAKIDLEGKDQVPIAWFNRLVVELEDTILRVARDHVESSACYITASTACGDSTVLVDELNKLEEAASTQYDPKKKEDEIDFMKLLLETDIGEARAKSQNLKGEIARLENIATRSEDDYIKIIKAKNTMIKDYEDQLGQLLKSDTNDGASVNDSNKQLSPEIHEHQLDIENLRREKAALKGKGRQTDTLERQVNQLKLQADTPSTKHPNDEKGNNKPVDTLQAQIKALQDENSKIEKNLNEELQNLKEELESYKGRLIVGGCEDEVDPSEKEVEDFEAAQREPSFEKYQKKRISAVTKVHDGLRALRIAFEQLLEDIGSEDKPSTTQQTHARSCRCFEDTSI